MSYCTQQNLIDNFSELELIQRTDRINSGLINATVLNQAIVNADAEINGYLTAYTLPLTQIPTNFIELACDIVRYRLYDDYPTDTVRERYKNAIDYLKRVAEGKITLAADSTGAAQTPNNIVMVSSAPVFGVESFSTW